MADPTVQPVEYQLRTARCTAMKVTRGNVALIAEQFPECHPTADLELTQFGWKRKDGMLTYSADRQADALILVTNFPDTTSGDFLAYEGDYIYRGPSGHVFTETGPRFENTHEEAPHD